MKRKKQKKSRNTEKNYIEIESDEYFYYIAGYTSGGAAFGITWEEAREQGLIDESESEHDYEEELPF